jgi:hypothetical protein
MGFINVFVFLLASLHCKLQTILSLERAPYMKNKESNCHSDKCNFWSPAPKGARQQDELSDWPSVLMWPPLWSSSQSSWLQIQRSGFDSRRYQIFWEVVGLERGPLSLVSTTEELLGRKSTGSGLESRDYGRRDQSRWPRSTFYPQKLALISPSRSV